MRIWVLLQLSCLCTRVHCCRFFVLQVCQSFAGHGSPQAPFRSCDDLHTRVPGPAHPGAILCTTCVSRLVVIIQPPTHMQYAADTRNHGTRCTRFGFRGKTGHCQHLAPGGRIVFIVLLSLTVKHSTAESHSLKFVTCFQGK